MAPAALAMLLIRRLGSNAAPRVGALAIRPALEPTTSLSVVRREVPNRLC